LLSDFGFKRIFGSEPNKALLIAFLNEIFQGKKRIIDLVYNQNEYPGADREQGTIIFDLLCTTDKGERILIEVQKSKQENFFQRALFYGSRLISSQIPVGRRQQWGYRFTGVYVIAILDKFILPQALSAHYLHHICLRDRDGGNFVYDDFGLLFIELLKFDKQEHELETDLEKWLYVLKHISTLDKLPLVLRKSIFERLFDIAAYVNLSEKEKTMYDISLKHQWDKEGALLAMRNDLIAEIRDEVILGIRKEVMLEIRGEVTLGIRGEVMLEIRQEIALEMSARETQVKLAKALAIAKNLKKVGFDFAAISKATGLSEDEVESL
uniref:Rpn family recombination-promoting nuclease/putative transposase n=1 Tax=Pedobacter antarcticus TaxID=34086 RepID=UPI002930B09D